MSDKILDECCYPKKIEDKKSTKTAFIMMMPAFIIAVIAAYYSPLIVSMLSIILAIYQFIMLKQFIEDYYKKG